MVLCFFFWVVGSSNISAPISHVNVVSSCLLYDDTISPMVRNASCKFGCLGIVLIVASWGSLPRFSYEHTFIFLFSGKKGHEVVVQGGVIDDLAKHMIEQYGIPKRFIEVLDKTRRWVVEKGWYTWFFLMVVIAT